MAQDSMYFPGQAGGAVLPYDVEEDKPRSKAPLPPIHAYAGHRETGVTAACLKALARYLTV